jgi:glycosyltransferase involved in cell wall biosynthesis
VGIAAVEARVARDRDVVMICDVDLDVPDGARTHTVEIAAGFAAAGLEVQLVARGSDPGLAGVQFARAVGGEHERGRRLRSFAQRSLEVLWRDRGRSRRLYVRYKWSTLPATVVARLLGYRVVTEVNDFSCGPTYRGEIAPHVDYAKRALMTLMGLLSHGVVAGTEEAKTLLAGEFHIRAGRIHVVPIGVDLDWFTGLDRPASLARAGLDPSRSYVLFVGNFASWVDFDLLLDAFAIVAREAPGAHLLLLGDGEQRHHVDSRISALGIEDRVRLLGFLRDREAVRDLLAAATVVVASHRGEDLDRIGMNATKIAEYLGAGRAVVAKDVAGLREMIQDTGAGRVARDPEEMAAAIVSLLDPVRADAVGAVGRELARTRYSWDSTIRQTLPMFD